MNGDQLRQRQARVRIRIAFVLATLPGAAFAVCYAVDAGEQALGVTIALAFGSIAYGLGAWARLLLPTGGYVQSREPSLRPPPAAVARVPDLVRHPRSSTNGRRPEPASGVVSTYLTS